MLYFFNFWRKKTIAENSLMILLNKTKSLILKVPWVLFHKKSFMNSTLSSHFFTSSCCLLTTSFAKIKSCYSLNWIQLLNGTQHKLDGMFSQLRFDWNEMRSELDWRMPGWNHWEPTAQKYKCNSSKSISFVDFKISLIISELTFALIAYKM